MEFYWPDKWRKAADNVKQGSSNEEATFTGLELGEEYSWRVGPMEMVGIVVDLFNQMIKEGVCAEQARMILPQNLYTQFYMTGNLRNWCHFLKLRLDSHAQKEARDIATQCAALIKPLFPVSFEALMND